MDGVLTKFVRALLVKAAAVEKHVDHLRTTQKINVLNKMKEWLLLTFHGESPSGVGCCLEH